MTLERDTRALPISTSPGGPLPDDLSDQGPLHLQERYRDARLLEERLRRKVLHVDMNDDAAAAVVIVARRPSRHLAHRRVESRWLAVGGRH